MNKTKLNVGLTILLIVVILATVGAYHYFFVYKAPEAVSSRKLQETNEAYDYLMAQSKVGLASYDYVVLINPSHGGDDTGATLVTDEGRLNESDVALVIAQYVRTLNDDSSIGILLTRNTDTNPTFEQRNSFITDLKPDMVIDLHVSEDTHDSSVMGVRTYYRSDFYRYDLTNEELADIIERNVALSEGGVALGLCDIVGMEDSSEYDFIKDVKVPCVALSCGYISNSLEAEALTDSAYQKSIAQGILNAIREICYE